jgi:hypothetical protein
MVCEVGESHMSPGNCAGCRELVSHTAWDFSIDHVYSESLHTSKDGTMPHQRSK